MELLTILIHYILPFLLILTVLVVVHELGHYLVARFYGIKVEVFSCGFGKELFGYTDSVGTRWKFCLIPLGGYVKMFGDTDAASMGRQEVDSSLQRQAFHHQSVGVRAQVIFAGPLFNFLLAILLLMLLFMFYGQPFSSPKVSDVQPDSPAHHAGLQPGDTILSINGSPIERFEEIQTLVRLSPKQELLITVERQQQQYNLTAIPKEHTITDRFGNTHTIGFLGITRSEVEYRQHNPFLALWYASKETLTLTLATLNAVAQMILGTRGTEDIGGILRIAQMSGEVVQSGLVTVIWFMAILSLNLGLINLFPIPLLDGGHLVFYAIEAVRGKPLPESVQEYGLKIGFIMVLALIIFATWNDLVHLQVFQFLY